MPTKEKRENARLPARYASLFGTLRVHRGVLSNEHDVEDQIKLAQWDAAPLCRMEDCPAFSICDYKSKSRNHRCRTVVYYVHQRAVMYFESLTYKDDDNVRHSYATEAQLQDVGMKIIPLWVNICRAKIELAGAESLSYIGSRGNIMVHPLADYINKTMFTITKLEKECGLRQYMNSGIAPPDEPTFKDGDIEPDFYATLESKDGPQIQDPAKKKKKLYKRRGK